MGGIAALARQAGVTVSGCDGAVYPPMSTQLNELGIDIHEGFDAAQLDVAPDCVVVGNVIDRREERGFVVEFQGESGEGVEFFRALDNADDEERWELLQDVRNACIRIA